jgi:Ca2+-binding RTX toxin-like protein
MNGITSAARIVLVGTLTALAFGLASEQAQAAYTARVEAATLTLKGDAASDKLVLRLEPGSPNTLQADVDADGTADFSFDRSTFTAIDVRAGGGDDEVRIDQSFGAFPDEAVTMEGGAGADTLLGGVGEETFLGGGGDDFVDGNQGSDQASLGTGDDTFKWDPGDGSDVVDGQGGVDQLEFNGSNASEQIEVSANGPRVRFARNVGNIVMDLNGINRIDVRALGSIDTVTVNDLAGTDTKLVDVDLDAFGGGGDGQADTVVAVGSEDADRVSFTSPDGRPVVNGIGAQTRVTGGEAALDNLVVKTLGGSDTATLTVGLPSPIPLHVDGGDGDDTARYNGTTGSDEISLARNGSEVAASAPATALFETAAVESLVVSGLAGDDTIAAGNGIAELTTLTLNGGDGEDILGGGDGDDILAGGQGNDSGDGNRGADQASLGGGDDTFQWDPGDGSDVVEGQGGSDVMEFNGSAANESIDVSANGGRVRFFRNVANIAMDLDGVERVNFRALGGADNVVVNDLAGTDVETVDVDLNAIIGGGDSQPDIVTAVGTDGPDHVTLVSPGGFATVTGLSAEVLVESAEAAIDDVNVATIGGDDQITTGREVFGPASFNVDGGAGDDVVRYRGTDIADTIEVVANGTEVSTVAALASRLDTTAVESLVVLGLAGEDTIVATGNLAPLTQLTMDGGDDNDVLRGGNGADLLLGGNGNDFVDGNQGADRALLGADADVFQWDPGDGSDVVDGQAGADVLDFFASNASETIDISGDGGHLRIARNVGNVTMDADNVEALGVRTFGGVDAIAVNDLSGTGVETVDLDLNTSAGIGDLQADSIVVRGTNGKDSVQVTRSGALVLTTGLAARTRIAGGEGALDTLLIQTLDGNDDVTVSPDVGDLLATAVDLGPGE